MLPPCVTKRNCALNFALFIDYNSLQNKGEDYVRIISLDSGHAWLWRKLSISVVSFCTVYQYAVKVGGVDHITDSFNSFYEFAKVSCHLFPLDDFGIARKRRREKSLVHQGLEAHHNGVICKTTRCYCIILQLNITTADQTAWWKKNIIMFKCPK